MKINFKKLSKKQIILIIVAAVIAIVLISGTVYCAVNQETPIQMFNDFVKSDDEQIIGKWENETTPGLSAYEFFDDGTYDNYLSKFSFDGEYKIEGNQLTLRNPSTNQTVTYKVSIRGDKMTLTLYEDRSDKSTETQKTVYKRVDHLNMKSITDILGDLADESKKSDDNSNEDSAEQTDE